jgi:pyruvate-formate lyase
LKSASQNPAERTDLIVRTGGFSAYFVHLSGAIQDDAILRSEFKL